MFACFARMMLCSAYMDAAILVVTFAGFQQSATLNGDGGNFGDALDNSAAGALISVLPALEAPSNSCVFAKTQLQASSDAIGRIPYHAAQGHEQQQWSAGSDCHGGGQQ